MFLFSVCVRVYVCVLCLPTNACLWTFVWVCLGECSAGIYHSEAAWICIFLFFSPTFQNFDFSGRVLPLENFHVMLWFMIDVQNNLYACSGSYMEGRSLKRCTLVGCEAPPEAGREGEGPAERETCSADRRAGRQAGACRRHRRWRLKIVSEGGEGEKMSV